MNELEKEDPETPRTQHSIPKQHTVTSPKASSKTMEIHSTLPINPSAFPSSRHALTEARKQPVIYTETAPPKHPHKKTPKPKLTAVIVSKRARTKPVIKRTPETPKRQDTPEAIGRSGRHTRNVTFDDKLAASRENTPGTIIGYEATIQPVRSRMYTDSLVYTTSRKYDPLIAPSAEKTNTYTALLLEERRQNRLNEIYGKSSTITTKPLSRDSLLKKFLDEDPRIESKFPKGLDRVPPKTLSKEISTINTWPFLETLAKTAAQSSSTSHIRSLTQPFPELNETRLSNSVRISQLKNVGSTSWSDSKASSCSQIPEINSFLTSGISSKLTTTKLNFPPYSTGRPKTSSLLVQTDGADASKSPNAFDLNEHNPFASRKRNKYVQTEKLDQSHDSDMNNAGSQPSGTTKKCLIYLI